jgi:glycosyltransferase involved in cell wall biosynthesis
MRIAFYAPLKPPDDPTPSGDRLIARLFIDALSAGGFTVELASRLRTFDREGGTAGGIPPTRHERLRILADRVARRIIRRWSVRPPNLRPKAWFTYHLYHKAPDWVGPHVADAFGIPYLVAEASVTPRQATGPWAYGHTAVLAALGRADRVVLLNSKDEAGVLPHLRAGARVERLAPFIDAAPFLAPARPHHGGPLRLATVAMMREDVKRDSYRLLAEALTLAALVLPDWQLEVVGDGPASAEIQQFFAPLGGRVRFLGRLPRHRIAEVLATADLFVWPGIGEAIGMVYLEAQAAGLPVIGCDRPGIAGVVARGVTGLLPPEGDAQALAAALSALSQDPARRGAMAEAARASIKQDHDLPVATERLKAIVTGALR